MNKVIVAKVIVKPWHHKQNMAASDNAKLEERLSDWFNRHRPDLLNLLGSFDEMDITVDIENEK